MKLAWLAAAGRGTRAVRRACRGGASYVAHHTGSRPSYDGTARHHREPSSARRSTTLRPHGDRIGRDRSLHPLAAANQRGERCAGCDRHVARARLRSGIHREVDPPDERRTDRTEPARRSSRGRGWKTLVGNYWVFGLFALTWAIPTLTSHCKTAETLRDPEDGGVAQAKLIALLKDRTDAGCDVVNAPREYRGGSKTSFTVSGKGGSCVATVLISADPAERLQVSLRSPLGESLPVPPPAATVDLLLCPRMAGEYLVSARPATAASHAMATLHCDGPTMATHSAYRAAAEMVRAKLMARMESRLAAGCSVTPSVESSMGEQLWELNVKKTGACVEQLVESSAPDSAVTVTVTSPTSQLVPVSAPAPSLSVRYCPPRAGDYTHRTQSATDSRVRALDEDGVGA